MKLRCRFLYRPLFVIVLVLNLGISSVWAAPADPFTGAAPAFDAAPKEATDYNVGDWGVAEQNGAATYTYPISMPPGRNGMAPSLALRYSSQSPLRGGLAVGWGFDLPTVRIDTALGFEAAPIYRAALGGAAGRLVEVADSAPAASKAYRVDFDETFTRFFRFTTVEDVTRWQAWTTDGVIHDFGNEPAAGDRQSFWPVTRQTDRFGNTVQYFWVKTNYGYFVSYDLEHIEYTANANAGLAAHAKVEFIYAADTRCDGAPMPLGAAPLTSNILSGARQLGALKIFVRNEPNGTWQLHREVKLTYKLWASQLHFEAIVADPGDPDNNCRGQARLRFLTKVQETAYAPDGAVTMLPALTFTYNMRHSGPYLSTQPPPFPTPNPARTIPAPGFAQSGNSHDGATASLLDIDTDGIRDRVGVITENEICTLVWYRGRFGGEFESEAHKSPLPTMPWYYETENHEQVTGLTPSEQCTFGGQITFREVSKQIPELPRPIYERAKGVFVYSFMDYTRDGRVDLLVAATGILTPTDSPPTLPFPIGVTINENTAPRTATWYLYHNDRERPEYNIVNHVQSDFSVQAFTIASPVPLGAAASEEEIGNTVSVKGMPPALFDLDGDGFLDAIIRSGAPGGDVGGCYSPGSTKPFWCVFFGNGGQTFRVGYRWPRPIISGIADGVSGYRRQDTDIQGRIHERKWDVAMLQDVDGDGLADLIVQEEIQPNQYRLRAYRNHGYGFADTPIDLGRIEPIEKSQTDYWLTTGANIIAGDRGYRRRLLDLDSDGLVDILFVEDDDAADKDNITRDQIIFAAFNFGGFFTPGQKALPVEWRIAKRLFHAEPNDDVVDRLISNWWVRNDFYDATGDGLADMVSFADDGRSMSVVEHPGLRAAPDLLQAVENGRGLRIEFAYAPTTDSAAVQWDPQKFQLNPVKWVVSETRLTGGFTAPAQVIRYTYKNPITYRVKKDALYPEPDRFAGFATVTRIEDNDKDAPLRRVIHQYDYDLAPDGHLRSEWVFRTENGAFSPQRHTHNDWESAALFGGRINFVHQTLSLTRTCLPGASVAECAAQIENVHRAQEGWTPVAATGASSLCPADASSAAAAPAVLYVHTLSQTGSGPTVGPLDRRTQQCFQIRYGQSGFAADDYRILPTKKVGEVVVVDQNGLRFEVRAQSETHYNPATGLPTQSDQWLDAATIASTKRAYDSKTGNLVKITKAEQALLGQTVKSTIFRYDPHALFVRSTTNELDHQVITIFDVATGALLRRQGPNFAMLPTGEKVWERELWRIDGFGRVLEHAVSLDDATAQYDLRTVEKMSYFDAEQPNRVRSEQLLEVGGSRWITVDQMMDGLGRVMTDTQVLDGDLTAITTYAYDSAGNLIATEVPDPRSDDGTRLRYSYAYDGLGRLTQFARPNATGLTVTYAGLEKTIQEVTSDNSGATKKEVNDVFGRLIELHEFDPVAPSAVTRYQYDGDDNLVLITDAEGNQTQLEHDWLGHRIAVTRGERSWRYTYDCNGNIRTRAAPVPAGADPAFYTTVYLYDDLDRLTQMTYADQQITVLAVPAPAPTPTPEVPDQTGSHRVYLPAIMQMGAAEQGALAGAGAPFGPDLSAAPVVNTIVYRYDEGRNGLGRLSRVKLPFGDVRYTYEARGLVAGEERSFTLTDVATASATQWVQRQYNALGLPTLSQWDDGQQWQISYDGRGLVDQVQWFNPQAQTWQAVADFDRSLAGLPRTRSSAFGQTRQYTYDLLARPAQETVTVNGNTIATRGYEYNGAGDLVHVTGATSGVSAEASYSYDVQHRLKSAAGPNGYAGAFSYSAAGNLLTANVTWNGSSESRNVRYEYGTHNPQAVDRLVDQTNGATYAAFSYDLAGNMIQRSTPAGEMALLWDGHDQLRLVDGPQGPEVHFYDQDGQRMLAVSKAEGVRFWFGESETHFDLAGVQTKRYLHLSAGGAALARVKNGNKLELQYADALQNLMFSLDTAGNVIASFLYGPFGEVVQTTGDADHRRQFNGKENDAVSGLRYYGYRYYDPLTLRWNSADPLYRVLPDLGVDVPQRMNLYSFSLNNPVRYYDPDGRDAKSDTGKTAPTDECKKQDREVCDDAPSKPKNDKSTKKNGSDQQVSKEQVVKNIRSCRTQECVEMWAGYARIHYYGGDDYFFWQDFQFEMRRMYVLPRERPPNKWLNPNHSEIGPAGKGIRQEDLEREAKAQAELFKTLEGPSLGAIVAGNAYNHGWSASQSASLGSIANTAISAGKFVPGVIPIKAPEKATDRKPPAAVIGNR